jgi:hypothetical protein
LSSARRRRRRRKGGGNAVPGANLKGMQGEKGAQECLASATEGGVDGDVFGGPQASWGPVDAALCRPCRP